MLYDDDVEALMQVADAVRALLDGDVSAVQTVAASARLRRRTPTRWVLMAMALAAEMTANRVICHETGDVSDAGRAARLVTSA